MGKIFEIIQERFDVSNIFKICWKGSVSLGATPLIMTIIEDAYKMINDRSKVERVDKVKGIV